MKLNPSQDTALGGKATLSPATDRTRAADSASAKTPAGGAPDGAATVHLSELSSHLHALESSLAAGNVFDPAKVEAIKQAIRDGTLTVNPEVVSDRMLAGLRELFTKGR